MRVFPSVRARLTAWNVGVVACVLIFSGFGVRYLLERGLMRGVDQDLARQSQFWGGFFSRLPDPGPGQHRTAPRTGPGSSPPGGVDGFRPRLLDERGLDYWRMGPWDRKAFDRALRGDTLSTTVVNEGRELRVYSQPGYREGRIRGVVQLVEPLAPTRKALDELTRTLVILVPIALALAALGGAFLTGRALQPIREITRTATQIDPQNLSARIPTEGKDELAQLAGVLNGMLSRLEEAFERQKRFAGDASHELRTPLATIKASSSLAQEDAWGAEACQTAMASIEAAADRATRIVDDLLLLARSDSNRLLPGVAELPIGEVLGHAVLEAEAAWEKRSPHARIRLELPEAELPVTGELSHLTRLFLNLLDNALRHTPADGEVIITAAGLGSQVVVTISDTGEGIPPEHLPHLGERFYRVEASRERKRGGAGLGLAICRAIAEAHHGRLDIQSDVGKGTIVAVTLPG
jgi:signal transduction histidine kinase